MPQVNSSTYTLAVQQNYYKLQIKALTVPLHKSQTNDIQAPWPKPCILRKQTKRTPGKHLLQITAHAHVHTTLQQSPCTTWTPKHHLFIKWTFTSPFQNDHFTPGSIATKTSRTTWKHLCSLPYGPNGILQPHSSIVTHNHVSFRKTKSHPNTNSCLKQYMPLRLLYINYTLQMQITLRFHFITSLTNHIWPLHAGTTNAPQPTTFHRLTQTPGDDK